MHIFSDFNEFKAAVGTELGVSEWIDVTEERINLLRRRPATTSGSTSTRSRRKRGLEVASPLPTDSCR